MPYVLNWPDLCAKEEWWVTFTCSSFRLLTLVCLGACSNPCQWRQAVAPRAGSARMQPEDGAELSSLPSACQQSASGHCSKSWTLSTGPTPTTWSEISHLEQRLGWQSSSRWWKEVLGSILQSPQQIGSCVAGLWVWASIGWKQRCLSEGATRTGDVQE